MKKVLCMLVGILFSAMGVLQAQTEGGLLVLRGGFATNNFKGRHIRADILPSYDVSLDFNRFFYKKCYWNTGVMFSTRGFDSEHRGKLRAHTFGIPLTLGHYHKVTGNLAVDIRFGGFFTVDMAGQYEENHHKKTKIRDIEGYRRCDGGFVLGFGIWYRKINLDYSFRRGFGRVWHDNGPKNSINHVIRLGYAF